MPPPLVATWGESGSLQGQFQTPEGVEVDEAGLVYVVDQGNYRVQIFSRSGASMSAFGTFGNSNPGDFMRPRFATLDSRGHLCVTDDDWGNARTVDIFTAEGEFRTWLRLGFNVGDHVAGIAASSGGSIYIAFNNAILRYSAVGEAAYEYVMSWGGGTGGAGGAGPGELLGPQGLAIDGAGNIVVADEGNHRIQVFSADGVFLRQWGYLGSGDREFNGPHDVAVDSHGRMYVVDSGNQRVQVFTAEGTFLLKWGTAGGRPGEFQSPRGIAIDFEDYIYVIDGGNARVQKFGPVPP
jgi:DNA-binding beta-propeller fold protein YncE